MNPLLEHIQYAVEPVLASRSRKRKMQAELLDHLTAIYEEELPRCGDQTTALAAAIARFGESTELTRELQDSVPLLESCDAWCDRWIRLWPDESPLRHALRLAGSMAAIVMVTLVLIPLLLLPFDPQHPKFIHPASMAVVIVYMFLSCLWGFGLVWELTCGAKLWQLRAAGYATGSLLMGVGLVMAQSFVQPENSLWDYLLTCPTEPYAVLSWILFTLIFSLFGPTFVAALLRRDRMLRQNPDEETSLA